MNRSDESPRQAFRPLTFSPRSLRAAALVAAALSSAIAAAAEDAKDDVQKQLDALKQQVKDLQGRLDEELVRPADVQGVTTDLENFKYQVQRDRETKSALSTRNLLLGGSIQTRAAWYSEDVTSPIPGNIAATSVNNPAIVKGRQLTFDVPSAILRFSGLLFRDYQQARNLRFALGASASPGSSNTGINPNTNAFLTILDANIAYDALPTIENDGSRLSFTFGQQQVPFGLEANTTEELKPVVNNALFVGASNNNGAGLTSGVGLGLRQIGLVAKGEFFAQYDFGYNYRQALLAFALGTFNGTGPNRDDDNFGKDFIARLAVTIPAEYNSWLRELRIGASYYKGRGNLYSTDASGASSFAAFGNRDRWGADIYYNHFPFGLTYEYVHLIDDAYSSTAGITTLHRDSHTATVFYSFGQQFLTSVRNQAKFDDWWPTTVQPFLRYDRFDPKKGVANNETQIFTAGLNVFFAETTKAQLNVNVRDQRVDETQRKTSVEVLAQLQFGF